MARYKYAASTGDFLIDISTGKPAPNVEFDVYTAQTGGTKINTTLQDASGADITAGNPLKSDSTGFVQFYGPDEVRSDLWIDTGTGSRMLVRAATSYALQSDLTATATTASSAASAVASLTTAVNGKLDSSSFTAARDLLVGTGPGTATALTAGSSNEGKFLRLNSNNLSWENPTPLNGAGFSATSIADLPVGTIVQYLPGKNQDPGIPDGWLELNGAVLNSADYPALAALYGTSYGGTSPTTFALPDTRGRVLAGRSINNPAYSGLGVMAGSDTATLAAQNIPPHSHDMQHTHTATTASTAIPYSSVLAIAGSGQSSPDPLVQGKDTGASSRVVKGSGHTHSVTVNASSKSSTGSYGGSGGAAASFSILQPYLPVVHIVKAKMLAGAAVPAWVRDVDLPLSSAATTASGGTWAQDAGQSALKVSLSATGSAFARPTTPSFSGGAGYAVQADFRFDSSGFATNPGNKLLGIGFSTTENTTQTDGISVRISGTGVVSAYNAASAVAGLTAGTMSISGNTWYTIRLQYAGGCVMVYSISGTTKTLLLRTSPNTTSTATLHPNIVKRVVYPILVAESVSSTAFAGYFRNFKAWSLETGDLA